MNILRFFASGSVVILIATGFAMPANAGPAHCDYQLYVKAIDRQIKVCQTVDDVAACGQLMLKKYDRSMAHQVGDRVRADGAKRNSDSARGIKLIEGDCSLEAVVGICVLPHTKIYFYEGDAGELAAGCDRMKGAWRAKRF